jgi:hypothetical protein
MADILSPQERSQRMARIRSSRQSERQITEAEVVKVVWVVVVLGASEEGLLCNVAVDLLLRQLFEARTQSV